MDWWQYVLMFGAAMVGGLIAFVLRKNNPNILKLVLAFSGSYIFGITVLHLLPELYELHFPNTGMYILAGFVLQIGLEYFSQGIEHGHIHKLHAHNDRQRIGLAVSIMIGLSVHCFLEGMPVFVYDELHQQLTHSTLHEGHSHGASSQNYLLYGILLHKIPAAFALVLLLLLADFSVITTAILLVVYSSMAPLGAFVAWWLKSIDGFNAEFFAIVTSIVIGSFLHISTTILFESDEKHHEFNWKKLLTILIGFGLSLLSAH